MVRRKFRGALRTPKCGYGSNKLTRHLLPNYKLKFVINNVDELDCLLMNNDKYCAEIASTVGAVKRIAILRRAKELGVSVTNQKSSKITKLEDKKKRSD
jgi:large subunit ribosomal protein L32e